MMIVYYHILPHSLFIRSFQLMCESRVLTLTSTLYYTATEKATLTFIKLPPRLRNNCAEPVYNFGDDDFEGITQERERE